MASKALSLKLLVNKSTKRVLFAEASKEFVDFLFTLLAMPIGTVIQLVSASNMPGSVGTLYSSLDYMSPTYLQKDFDKDLLLKPQLASGAKISGLLMQDESQTPQKPAAAGKNPAGVGAEGSGAGYVQGVVTYMVMDDLSISPMSTISGISILNKYNVKEVGALEEKTVHVGMQEVSLGIKYRCLNSFQSTSDFGRFLPVANYEI